MKNFLLLSLLFVSCAAFGQAGTGSASPSNPGGGIPAISSPSTEGSRIFKTTPGNLYGICVHTGATAGWLMMFDATTVPGEGAVTPKEWVQVAANQSTCLGYGSGPPSLYTVGIVAVFSSTGPFTKTVSATAAFTGRFK